MNEIIAVNTTCAVICAKWALDLGFSQLRQIVNFFGGLLFGPIMRLVLYIFLVKAAKKEAKAGGNVL